MITKKGADNSLLNILVGRKEKTTIPCHRHTLSLLVLIEAIYLLPGVEGASQNTYNYSTKSYVQVKANCDIFQSDLFNHSLPFKDGRKCSYELNKIHCNPMMKKVCLSFITKESVFAGCINSTGLIMNGKMCPIVTQVAETNKYVVYCYDNECLTCTDSDSLQERLLKCLNQDYNSHSSRVGSNIWIIYAVVCFVIIVLSYMYID